MEIEVKVVPHSSSMDYYIILWRHKKKWFNCFNFWKRIVTVWDGAYLTYDQPVMFDNFDIAVNYAKNIKENPELITKHYEKQDLIYEKAVERRKKRYEDRNKSIKL